MKFRFVPGLLLLAFTAGMLGGCLSQTLNRSAGGDLVWYCDRCKARVGSKDTHACGLTKYDPETGRDVPMEGVAKQDVQMALEEESAGGAPASSAEEPTAAPTRRWWQFWRRSPEPIETLEPEPEPEPEPHPANVPAPMPEEKSKRRSWWKFWRR